MTQLEDEFQAMLLDDARIVHQKSGYYGGWFVDMVVKQTGVGAARHLIDQPEPQSGLNRLWLEGQRIHQDLLQYSLEARMLMPKYAPLFKKAQLDTAYDRLALYDDYCPPWAKDYKRQAG